MAHRSIKASATLLLSALFVLALSAPASADSQSRPFSGRVSGEASFISVPLATCPANGVFFGGLQTVSAASGQALHLGRVAMTSYHCTPIGDAIGPGVMTLTAANGDELDLTYAGTGPFPGPGTVVIVIQLTFEVVGGTGRFEGATGGGTMTALIDFEGFDDPSWAGTWFWDGTIGY